MSSKIWSHTQLHVVRKMLGQIKRTKQDILYYDSLLDCSYIMENYYNGHDSIER